MIKESTYGNGIIVTCSACKWWGLPTTSSGAIRMCRNPKLNAISLDSAGSDDGYGRLETGPNFGCVHGEREREALLTE